MSKEIFDYFEVDALAVIQESERVIASQKQSQAAEASLTDLDEYLSTLPIEAHEAALNGIKEYAEAVQREREIELGWHSDIQ